MSHLTVSVQGAQSCNLDKPKDAFATIEPFKNFVAFVLSAHYVHGELIAVVCGHSDEKETDCNQMKKVRPTSTSFVNVSWKNRHEIIWFRFFPNFCLKFTSSC